MLLLLLFKKNKVKTVGTVGLNRVTKTWRNTLPVVLPCYQNIYKQGCVEMATKKDLIVLAIERDEKGNLSTWCSYCEQFHHHGVDEGHRVAHCVNEDSPYIHTGYVLRKMKLSGKEIVRKEN